MPSRISVAISGAGPAGLAAAYELLTRSKVHRVVFLEESQMFGGISRTVVHNGNRTDMGDHRFFTKVPEVNAWWDRMIPRQGAPSFGDKTLGRPCTLADGGPDPESTNRVMLPRNRLSRIFFNHKFLDYNISLKSETFANMGLGMTFVAGCSYQKAALFKRKEKSLEDFYISRFGKKLYSMFFEHHSSQIDSSWGAQRVKGVSILAGVKNAILKPFRRKGAAVETSLIEEFSYPKLGPGMGRFQIYKNWSPYFVKDPEHTVWIGLEYFCNEGDDLWSMSNNDFTSIGVWKMVSIGMIASETEALDTHVEWVRKAYPAHSDSYAEFPKLSECLDPISNLYSVGRNGQQCYNITDHSMFTAFEAFHAIFSGTSDHSAVWSVNTEKKIQ